MRHFCRRKAKSEWRSTAYPDRLSVGDKRCLAPDQFRRRSWKTRRILDNGLDKIHERFVLKELMAQWIKAYDG